MTICEKCGAERDFIAEACPNCHFQPTTNRELAIASFLTTRFSAGDEHFGTEEEQLQLIASQIKAGKEPHFEEAELARHEETAALMAQVKPIHVYGGLLRLFLPAIIFLVILWGLIWFFKIH